MRAIGRGSPFLRFAFLAVVGTALFAATAAAVTLQYGGPLGLVAGLCWWMYSLVFVRMRRTAFDGWELVPQKDPDGFPVPAGARR